MASLYKKPIVVRDPKTGEKVKTRSRKWWGRYRDALGTRYPLSPGCRQGIGPGDAQRHRAARRTRKGGAVGSVRRTLEASDRRRTSKHSSGTSSQKGVTDKQVYSAKSQVEKIAKKCKWKTIKDIKASDVQSFLGDLRRQGRSAQTCNHYLKSAKSFTRWLVRDRRVPENVLEHLSRMNVRVDRRHDRRALVGRRVLSAGRGGPRRAGDREHSGARPGHDVRARRLDRISQGRDRQPDASVAAARRRSADGNRRRLLQQAATPGHADPASGTGGNAQGMAGDQTETKLGPNTPLFPISGKFPGGTERKTHKMMQRDLARAKELWIQEVDESDEKERKRREQSDFLEYCNHDGLYADFHSNRHLFITSLERAGISPKMAQTLARHSDIRLTLGVYTHVGVHDQTAAIGALPNPRLASEKQPAVEARSHGPIPLKLS